MSEPEAHLIRTADLESAKLVLSELTGLSRLSFELHRLSDADQLSLPAGAEQFLYVLAGSVDLLARGEATESRARLETGDFVALTADETADLRPNAHLTILVGGPGRP